MREYFPKSELSRSYVANQLDSCNYVSKADLKNGTSIDTPDFSKKTAWSNFKSNVGKLDIDKFKIVPSNEVIR